MIFSAEKCCAFLKMYSILDSVFIYFVKYAYTKNVQIISVSFFKFYFHNFFVYVCIAYVKVKGNLAVLSSFYHVNSQGLNSGIGLTASSLICWVILLTAHA